MTRVHIAGAVRTPIGKFGGSLAGWTAADMGVAVVKVIDKDSNKVIRQIPSEEVLQISKALDKLQGLLVKQQA